MRRLSSLMVITVAVSVFGSPALGGGATWEFEGYHRPGDRVTSSTAVAWGFSGLGAPEDGPYLVYLAPQDLRWDGPGIPEEAMLVGRVVVEEGGYRSVADQHPIGDAIASFEIPDVPSGTYQLLHCNLPCTTTLGDIVGGWDLHVLEGEQGRTPEEVAAEVLATLVSSTPTAYRLVGTSVPGRGLTGLVGAGGERVV